MIEHAVGDEHVAPKRGKDYASDSRWYAFAREIRSKLSLDAGPAEAHYDYSFALAESGFLCQAINEYKKAIEMKPKLAKDGLSMQYVDKAQEMLHDAIAIFKNAF